jgi:hypothetical protein
MVMVTLGRPLPRDALELRPLDRPARLPLRLRGGHHRRPRLALGTLAGGIIIGVAQTLGAAVNPEWQILAGHLAFLVVLLVRPRGLFPRAVD